MFLITQFHRGAKMSEIQMIKADVFSVFVATLWSATVTVGAFVVSLHGLSAEGASVVEDEKLPHAQNSRVDLSRERLVAQVLDKNLRHRDRQAAYDDILQLKPEERATALSQIVTVGTPPYSSAAAVHSIRAGVPGILGVLAECISTWDPDSQVMVLSALRHSSKHTARYEIPRQILSSLLRRQGTMPRLGDPSDAVGRAATILSSSSERSDRDLIRKSVHRQPQSPRLWLAIAKSGTGEDKEFELALTVMRDGNASDVLRVAAAIAASKANNDASNFAISQIEQYVSAFGDETVGSLLAKLMSEDQQTKEEFVFFRDKLRLVGMLQFLDSERSKELTFKAINSQNEHIRTVAALVAVVRWPDDFLKLDEGTILPDEQVMLLAALVVLHPRLDKTVQQMVSNDRSEEARTRIRDFGIMAAFGTPGTAVFDF